MLEQTVWRLAPAFDLNPNIDKAEHILNIDDTDNRPSLETVLSTAAFYGIGQERAKQIVEEILIAVSGWSNAAEQAGILGGDVELTSAAFSAQREYRQRNH